jgi:PAS domain S-box-containing protein
MDKDLRYTYWNKASEILTGISADQALGKSLYEVFPDVKGTKAEKLYLGALRTRQPISFVNEYLLKGKNFFFEINAYPSERGLAVHVKDITERNWAEKVQTSTYKISEAAHSAENLEQLYGSIHNTITELMPAKNFYIALYDRASEMLTFPCFVDEYERNPGPQKLEKGLTEYVLRTGRPLLASPEVFDELEKKGEVESVGPPSIDWLGVPLKAKDRTIGVLTVQSYTEGIRYGEKDKDILTFISEQVAMAIERKMAEEVLRESVEKFRNLAEQSPNMIFINHKGRVVYANERCEEIMGYEKGEFYSPDFDFLSLIAPEHKDKVKVVFNRHMNGKEVPPCDYSLITKEGKRIDAILTTKLINYEGDRAILGIITDITERKKTEEQIKESLKEKEVLLKEVHHRVKNNMQIISSLLNLQSRHIKDEQASRIFKSSQNRVKSMSLIHERLYQSKDLAKIDFAEYTRSLTGHLFSSYGIDPRNINYQVNIKNVLMDISSAIPCGLIINELVSNSLKHAFPDGKKGEIRIDMHASNTNEIVLIVSDNGIGIPEEVGLKKPKTLGLHLVTILAEDQLNGNIELDRRKGTKFKMRLRTKQ